MPKIVKWTIFLSALVFLTLTGVAQPAPQPAHTGGAARAVLLDDFETYRAGGLPDNWQFLKGRTLVPVTPDVMTDREQFFIVQEQGNKFVRARVTDQAHRIVLTNGQRFDWDLQALPYLRWDWRAVQLPPGAREDQRDKNDTGAALYVFFTRDWLGRPRTIKYTYSSTLPVGTEVSYGSLQVIVVSSAARQGTGNWITVERNVARDYERLFGRPAPDRPSAIALWSDADNTHQTTVADFDNLELMPGPTASR